MTPLINRTIRDMKAHPRGPYRQGYEMRIVPPTDPEDLWVDATWVSAILVQRLLKGSKLKGLIAQTPALSDEDLLQQGITEYLSIARRFQGSEKKPWDRWRWLATYHNLYDYARRVCRDADRGLTSRVEDRGDFDILDLLRVREDRSAQMAEEREVFSTLPLSEVARDILWLRYGEGKGNGEIAKLRGLTVDHVGNIIKNSLQILKTSLVQYS